MSDMTTDRIPFSVAMSVYKSDNPEWFDTALKSITNQTVKPYEIVLVVDGPVSDAINNVIDLYQQRCRENNIAFQVLHLPENKGLGNALRIAVENCSHELIARMDSDDIAVSTRFEEQLNFMKQHPEVDVLGGDIAEFIGDIDNVVGKRTVPCSETEIAHYLKKRCPFNHMTVMYKKQAVQASGGYLDWFWNEDYYLWLRMYLNGCHFGNTGTVLVNVRVGEEMYQRRGGKRYFESEITLQNYMLDRGIIEKSTYVMNCAKRLIVQRILPNRIRGWVFRTFARTK